LLDTGLCRPSGKAGYKGWPCPLHSHCSFFVLVSDNMPKVVKTSTDRRKELAARICAKGHAMPTPCSRCVQDSRRCFVDLSSGFCSECLDHGHKSCDLVLSDKEWDAVQEKQRSLQAELRVAEALRLRLVAEDAAAEAEAVAAAGRLRSARDRVREVQLLLAAAEDEERQLSRRELESIAELEKLEQEDAQRTAPVVPVSSSPDFLADVSWSRLASPSAWDPALLDAFGGTGSPAVGNSSGS